MKKALFLLPFLLVLIIMNTNAQQQQKKLPEPIWIKMMRDPNTNYYKTIEAFREFWEYRILPKEPFVGEEKEDFEDEVGLDEEEITDEQRKKFLSKDPYRNVNFANEVKAFKGWMKEVEPWLKEDGTIYSVEERQKMIDKQQKELKEIENKNVKN